MAKKRIVVTGLGVASCFGNDVETFYQDLLDGKSGIKTITDFPCDDFPTRFAGVIENFDAGDYIDRKRARRIDKFLAYTMVAGKKALESSNASLDDLSGFDKKRCGVLVGSGLGGLGIYTQGVLACHEAGLRKLSPFFIPYTLTNMGGALLGIDLGFRGPNYSISTACATANYAIINAAQHIQKGEADLMICGGVEAPITRIGLAGFCACKALSQNNADPEKASRPWTRGRDGFVMGEGAGILVLEDLEHALKRGAPIYAEYLGGGMSCDAHHITELREDGSGLVLCMENALRDAGIDKADVNLINAHATSTPQGDMVEVGAIRKLFGKTDGITMQATKSMTGHALGAAGGLEAIATIKACQTRKVHPTRNFEDPEPGLDFDIPTEAVERDIKYAISNSFGFGGHNATVAFAPYDD